MKIINLKRATGTVDLINPCHTIMRFHGVGTAINIYTHKDNISSSAFEGDGRPLQKLKLFRPNSSILPLC